ncbi:MAG: M61 family metallopeptidase, partial [Aeromicrobium sp.]|nr:M61 family metallopeptidase [Burkholderiales bacterium]
MIRYRIIPVHPAAHLFEVTVTVDKTDQSGQRFMLPTWIPGSYMIREFARHIGRVVACSGDESVACEKINKCTWQCAPVKGALTLTYTVYAWDLSVRGAHLDDSHGFFNGANVFLLVEGQRESACEIEIIRPVGERYQDWKVATSLAGTAVDEGGPAVVDGGRDAGPAVVDGGRDGGPGGGRDGGPGGGLDGGPGGGLDFGLYKATNYDELIDHPVEMGNFTHASFDACGVKHHVVLTGRHRADMARLTTDLQKICEAQIRLFEPETAAAPMSEYWFLITVVGDGFGGLEHRASTALIVSRDELPLANEPRVTTGYRKLLSLVSHEYFHTWNVKRILPARFTPYDLTQENYTKQLWFFEGFTDYYDDLMLVRCGLITTLEYLEIEADGIGRVFSQAGRTKQSVAESSFDAWIKYYRQDESSPNSIVSYYQKGALVGMALDLTIREATQDRQSLDDVMRQLWTRFGKTGVGVPEGEIERVASEIAGIDLSHFFVQTVYGTADPDLVRLLATAGIPLSWRAHGTNGSTGTSGASGASGASSVKGASITKAPERVLPTLGAKLIIDGNGDAKLAQVFDGGSALAAGLSAGD